MWKYIKMGWLACDTDYNVKMNDKETITFSTMWGWYEMTLDGEIKAWHHNPVLKMSKQEQHDENKKTVLHHPKILQSFYV